MKANNLDKDDTSVEDKENDDLDDVDGILKDLDNDAKNEENVFVSPKEVDVRKNDRSQKSANLSEIHDIEKKIDDGSSSISDHEKRVKLLQDIDKLENLEALDLI
nr:RNA-directed DNA polymerase, eukaryota, reverse transcriptase zinc-binding domain protein [Tanacetum cinerariifolium]